MCSYVQGMGTEDSNCFFITEVKVAGKEIESLICVKMGGRHTTSRTPLRVIATRAVHVLHRKQNNRVVVTSPPGSLRHFGGSQSSQNPHVSSGHLCRVLVDNGLQILNGLVQSKVVRNAGVNTAIALASDAIMESQSNKFGGVHKTNYVVASRSQSIVNRPHKWCRIKYKVVVTAAEQRVKDVYDELDDSIDENEDEEPG